MALALGIAVSPDDGTACVKAHHIASRCGADDGLQQRLGRQQLPHKLLAAAAMVVHGHLKGIGGQNRRLAAAAR